MNKLEFPQHPLIYCNGDSYSDQNYQPELKQNIYADVVGRHIGGFVFNRAKIGSSNRRIVRTTLHDALHQRQLNPTQKIIMLIGLSFEIRGEVWVDSDGSGDAVESNFKTHNFTFQPNWREKLLQNLDIGKTHTNKFETYYDKGRAYFYSPYAERINLLGDLIMLRAVLDSLNIDFLIFQAPPAEVLESDYLLDFFKQQMVSDARFFDFEQFSFCDWCYKEQFIPYDYLDRPRIGHYKADAHREFAKQVLIPHLEKLNII